MSTLTRSLETLRDRRARGERPAVSVGGVDHEFLGVIFGGSSPSVSLVDESGRTSSKTAADWKRLGAEFRGRSRDLAKSTRSSSRSARSARSGKMTTASLGSHHVRWLREEASREGADGLVRTCDLALSLAEEGGVGMREIGRARKAVVDEINRRAGRDVARVSEEAARETGRGQLAEMERLLEGRGFDPSNAKALHLEGMGALELEERLRIPSGVGSLQYTHGIARLSDPGVVAKSKAQIEREIEAVRGRPVGDGD